MQSVYKDNELEAHVILAQLFNDGWLPIQQTLLGKSIRAWLKEYHPEAAQHPAAALQVLLLKLKEQSTESGTQQTCFFATYLKSHPSACHTRLSSGSGVHTAHTHIIFGNADEHLALSPDGNYVRRKVKYEWLSAAELGFCKATKAVQISLQLASGSKHTGVMVPADSMYAPKHLAAMHHYNS